MHYSFCKGYYENNIIIKLSTCALVRCGCSSSAAGSFELGVFEAVFIETTGKIVPIVAVND